MGCRKDGLGRAVSSSGQLFANRVAMVTQKGSFLITARSQGHVTNNKPMPAIVISKHLMNYSGGEGAGKSGLYV